MKIDASRPDGGSATAHATEHRRSRWTWVLPVSALVLGALLFALWPGFRHWVQQAFDVAASGDVDRIRDWVQGHGPWSLVVLAVLFVGQAVVAFLPSVVMIVVCVVAYGSWLGGALAMAGLMLAATVAWGIGAAFEAVTVERLLGSRTHRQVQSWMDRYGIWVVVAARLGPVLSTDAVSMAAGLAGMHYGRFIAATAASTLPLVAFVAFLGADAARLKAGLFWFSIAGGAALVAFVAVQVARRWRRHRATA